MGAGGDEETSNEIKEKESKNKRNYRADNCIFKKDQKKMNLEQKKDLRKYLLVRRLKKISEPIKIKTRIIKKDKAKRINLISLESTLNDYVDMKLIYKKKRKNGKIRTY